MARFPHRIGTPELELPSDSPDLNLRFLSLTMKWKAGDLTLEEYRNRTAALMERAKQTSTLQHDHER